MTLYAVRATWTDDDGQTQTRWMDSPVGTCSARDKADAGWMPVALARHHLAALARESPAVTFALIAEAR